MFRGFFLPPCWTEETRKVRKTAYKILFLRPIQKPSISRRFFKKKKKKENNSTSRGKDLLFKWNWRGAEMHKYRFRFELNEDKKGWFSERGKRSININFVAKFHRRQIGTLWSLIFFSKSNLSSDETAIGFDSINIEEENL